MNASEFFSEIARFNRTFGVDCNYEPTDLGAERISDFRLILIEELNEAADIKSPVDLADWLGDIVVYCASEARRWGVQLTRLSNAINSRFYWDVISTPHPRWRKETVATHASLIHQTQALRDVTSILEFGDWLDRLAHIAAFHATLAEIHLPKVLTAIMESNFSKLDEKGNPIINVYGKIEKGPNFKPPEPAIRKALFGDV